MPVGQKTKNEKVIVAMSGGVDSSVAALLLSEEGYEVIGVTMKLFCLTSFNTGNTETGCCSLDSIRAAQQVADGIGIAHTVIDMEHEFREEVLRNFFTEYSKGRTPNPCILCNSRIKFHHLLEKGRNLGARYLATGHYARIRAIENGGTTIFSLERAGDPNKDQSYFLWGMDQDALSSILFPLGGLSKSEVRALARKAGFAIAERPESQDFCFLLPGRYDLSTGACDITDDLGLDSSATIPGPIKNSRGEVIGTHPGIAHFTIGQRRGLGLALGRPAYVLEIYPETNTLIVGFEEDLFRRTFTVSQVNWISGVVPDEPEHFTLKVRSRSRPVRAMVTPTGGSTVSVELSEAEKAVTPGQSAVWYEGRTLIGGGVID